MLRKITPGSNCLYVLYNSSWLHNVLGIKRYRMMNSSWFDGHHIPHDEQAHQQQYYPRNQCHNHWPVVSPIPVIAVVVVVDFRRGCWRQCRPKGRGGGRRVTGGRMVQLCTGTCKHLHIGHSSAINKTSRHDTTPNRFYLNSIYKDAI